MGDDKKIEDMLYELVLHAQELQKAADQQTANVGEAILKLKSDMPEAVARLVAELLRQDALKAAADMRGVVTAARQSVDEQLDGVKAACDSTKEGIRNLDGVLNLLWWRGGAIVAVIMAIIVLGAYIAANNLRRERAWLSEEISTMNETYEELRGKTWGLTLHTAEDGKRWILLPRGESFGETNGWTRNGEKAVGIRVLSEGEQ